MRAAVDAAALDALFRAARSYNGYTDEPGSTDQLHQLWELMKWGPTSANQMPARLVWCVSDDAKAALADCCSAQNKPKILNAPVSVVIGRDTDVHEQLHWRVPPADARAGCVGKAELRQASAFRNSTLQGAYFIMAARALGLDTGPMSGFDAGAVDKAFFTDSPSVHANFISTLGHGDPASIFPRLPRPDFDTFNRVA